MQGEPSLYKVAAADVFSFPEKCFHIAEHINLPQPSAKSIQAAKAAGLPPMIIFHIQLPTYSVSRLCVCMCVCAACTRMSVSMRTFMHGRARSGVFVCKCMPVSAHLSHIRP